MIYFGEDEDFDWNDNEVMDDFAPGRWDVESPGRVQDHSRQLMIFLSEISINKVVTKKSSFAFFYIL